MGRHCLPSLVPLLRFVYDHMYTRTTLRLSLNASSPKPDKQRQHSRFNQQMSKEKNTQSSSYLLSLSLKDDKALEYGGALLMFHHIFF